MSEKQDGRGQVYFDVDNIRVTVIPETFNGNPGIRIQAYTGEGNKLHQGAELPIRDKETAFDILAAIHKALDKINY